MGIPELKVCRRTENYASKGVFGFKVCGQCVHLWFLLAGVSEMFLFRQSLLESYCYGCVNLLVHCCVYRMRTECAQDVH